MRRCNLLCKRHISVMRSAFCQGHCEEHWGREIMEWNESSPGGSPAFSEGQSIFLARRDCGGIDRSPLFMTCQRKKEQVS